MIDLPGLVSSSPICFMAALGLLRVLSVDQKTDTRLGWRQGHAVLEGIDLDVALDLVAKNMTDRAGAPEFNWADTPRKTSPEDYRKACHEMENDSRALSFMAGWATDTVVQNGAVAVTRMDMTSGQQKLFKDLRKLCAQVNRDHIYSALLGGAYEAQSSFGLDPIAVRAHALEAQAPTKTPPPGKPGLVWLAFEAIPLHPVVPVNPIRAETTGWRHGGNAGYIWPTWESLLGYDEVFYLRTLPVKMLPQMIGGGISEIWASTYGQSGKYGMLKPALRER